MKRVVEIQISTVLFWIAVVILFIMLAWWVLGESPTVEQLSIVLTAVGSWMAIKGSKDINLIKRLSLESKEQHSEQTQVLKDIRDILKRR